MVDGALRWVRRVDHARVDGQVEQLADPADHGADGATARRPGHLGVGERLLAFASCACICCAAAKICCMSKPPGSIRKPTSDRRRFSRLVLVFGDDLGTEFPLHQGHAGQIVTGSRRRSRRPGRSPRRPVRRRRQRRRSPVPPLTGPPNGCVPAPSPSRPGPRAARPRGGRDPFRAGRLAAWGRAAARAAAGPGRGSSAAAAGGWPGAAGPGRLALRGWPHGLARRGRLATLGGPRRRGGPRSLAAARGRVVTAPDRPDHDVDAEPRCSTCLSRSSYPLLWKPLTSPCRGNRRVSTPSSRDTTLALPTRVQATRRLALSASSTPPTPAGAPRRSRRAPRGAAAAGAPGADAPGWTGACGRRGLGAPAGRGAWRARRARRRAGPSGPRRPVRARARLRGRANRPGRFRRGAAGGWGTGGAAPPWTPRGAGSGRPVPDKTHWYRRRPAPARPTRAARAAQAGSARRQRPRAAAPARTSAQAAAAARWRRASGRARR